ncbi:hypothetical protein, partial [Mesorhizobium sp. M2E.F.Ca.ET.209.01.1.1]|uniref:hypothetical protein n=1 Tax=Mesorhizobium sp. M2E.F.Ca.ET.209.01.1.1 TaxID=2500526 RepID=UPI001AEE8C47
EFPEATRDTGIFWGIPAMKTKFAASVLFALLYAQGLLGFAALASVLLKERAHASEFVAGGDMASGPSLLVVR